MKKADSQNNKVLEHMRSNGGITSLDAIRYYGCTRLSARIADLKKRGYEIDSKMVDVYTRDGHTKVKRYSLAAHYN